MTHSSPESSRKTLTYAAATTVALILFLMWMEGAFVSKVAPGLKEARAGEAPPAERTARVEKRQADETFDWPGTVAALTVTSVAPKVPGRILEITVRSGDAVHKNQVLARLDYRELKAKLGQAKASLTAAEAEATRARANDERLRRLYQREAATRQQFDTARAEAQAGNARVMQARDQIRELESMLSETVLRAPYDSVVIKRDQEPGEMAQPGLPLLTLHQSGPLRIESAIPERCAGEIATGMTLTARVGHPPRPVPATIDEIQPSSDPRTRTVLVKARLPDDTPAQPGTFGWLEQSCGQETVLLIPGEAVTRIGQLESVRVLVNGTPHLRHVRTGKRFDGQLEILSGLDENDSVLLPGAHP